MDKAPIAHMHHPDLDLPLPGCSSTKLTNELKDKVEVLLVTVTAIEWSAVFRKMRPVSGANKIFRVHHEKEGYVVGIFGVYCVALLQTDKGERASQSEVHAALNCWNAKATILVGTCLSLRNDHKVGDVIVSSRLATYDQERRVSLAQSYDLGLGIEREHHLSLLFTKRADSFDWKFGDSKNLTGLLLLGSRIAENAEYMNELKLRYPEAIGVETDGNGAYMACYNHSYLKECIVVKGSCGFLGAASNRDEQVMRFAVAAATSLVLHVLSEDNLRYLGCKAVGDGYEPVKYWTPKEYCVFISYEPRFYRNHTKMVNGLLDTFEYNGIESHVSISTHVSHSFSTAKVDGAVFVALIDIEFYLQSKWCMRELKKALDSKEVKVLPILLSPANKYPSSGTAVKKLLKKIWDSEWLTEWKSYEEYLRVVQLAESLALKAKRRVYEDPSFGFNFILDDVKNLLRRLGVQGPLQKSAEVYTPSLWRMLHPIRECDPARTSYTTVDVHQSDFQKIVQVLTSKGNTSVSIAGLKAAGGVGKTVLARRIANCPTVKQHFASERVLWAEFGELDSTAEPALERIYRDLGGEEKLCFDEDSMGRLMKARESFELLLTRRQPTVLIVLDDVWKKKYLQVFQNVIRGTNVKILVTTRFKGMVEEVFGQESFVNDLNTCLGHEDALRLMNRYAGLGSVQKEDVSTMSKLAGHFGYHAKALAIVSARFKLFETWENLLSSVEEGEVNLDGAVEAREWVYTAIRHTLDFADPYLTEFFLQLGVLVEGARVSMSDLCILWNCNSWEAKAIAKTLFECSVLETEESPKHDEHAVYYMHDLVRDCARQDKHATEEREKEFVQKLIYNFYNARHLVTEYTIKYLPQHLAQDDVLNTEINYVYLKALDGHFEEEWSNTSFIVLTAFENRKYALSNAAVDLCMRNRFLETALDRRNDIELWGCKWMKDAVAFKTFAHALNVISRLRSIDLRFNKIGDVGTITLVNALKENAGYYLENLTLSTEYINPDGAKFLSRWLKVNNTLTHLNISGNAIRAKGAVAIGEAMKCNRTLKVLSLHYNNIGDIGSMELGKCLEVNNSILKLDLGSNNIGDDGTIALGNAIKVNSSLIELILNYNNIGDDGAITLGNSLKYNSTLNTLNLHNNAISDVGKSALKPYEDRVVV